MIHPEKRPVVSRLVSPRGSAIDDTFQFCDGGVHLVYVIGLLIRVPFWVPEDDGALRGAGVAVHKLPAARGSKGAGVLPDDVPDVFDSATRSNKQATRCKGQSCASGTIPD